MNTISNSRRVVLWIEDDLGVVAARRRVLEPLLDRHGCLLEVRRSLAEGREFLRYAAGDVAVVILDLDIPESPEAAGSSDEGAKPTGLKLLEEHGWLPFIVFSGHQELESQFPFPLPTPLAWLGKGADPEELGRHVGHILALQAPAASPSTVPATAASDDAEKIAREPEPWERRTLVCARFHLQGWEEPLVAGPPLVPWESFSLLKADELARECILGFGGRYLGWYGCDLLCEFPGASVDPDHLWSAMLAVTELWQRSYGPQGADRLRWNQWFIPPFSVGLLPNHANLTERLRPNEPGLHAMGRPGEVVECLARELPPGTMGLVPGWLVAGSRSENAFFNRGGGMLSQAEKPVVSYKLVVLPFSKAAVRVAYRQIQNAAAHPTP